MADTLQAQIMRAEQRLSDGRRRLDVGVTMFGQNVRKQLRSPTAFLGAGVLGFVAGDRARCGAAPKAAASSFFANTLSIVTLVQSVLMTIRTARARAVERGEELRDQEPPLASGSLSFGKTAGKQTPRP